MVAGHVFQVAAFSCNQSRTSDLCGFAVNLSLSPSCDGRGALQGINNRQPLVFPFIKKNNQEIVIFIERRRELPYDKTGLQSQGLKCELLLAQPSFSHLHGCSTALPLLTQPSTRSFFHRTLSHTQCKGHTILRLTMSML